MTYSLSTFHNFVKKSGAKRFKESGVKTDIEVIKSGAKYLFILKIEKDLVCIILFISNKIYNTKHTNDLLYFKQN